jgi:transposase
MITPPAGTRVWLAGGVTDMRKGLDGLALLVQEKLRRDPFGGQIFVFRGRRGQPTTFCIRFAIREDCLSLASAVRTDAAGLALPAGKGFDMHLHG